MTSYVLELGAGHDLGPLCLAFGFAFAAFLGVFRLRARMNETRGLVRTAWIFLCGLEAGGAVWATHFILLMGFHPGASHGFDTLQALLALLVSVIAAAVAFGVAWSGREASRLVAGALLLAGAIAATNYVGLSAYHVQAHVDYEAMGVWASVLLALLLSTAALVETDVGSARWRQVCAALLMSLAVGGLHLVGMHAMTFAPVVGSLPAGLIDGRVLGLVVAMLAVILTLVGVAAAYIDDAGSRTALQRSRRLTEATREGIVVIDAEGRIVDANTAFGKLAGAPDIAALRGRRLLGDLLSLDGRDLEPGDTREASLRPDGGDPFPVEVRLGGVGEQEGAALSVRDLREQREAERMIRHLADHDTMTGLANRSVIHRMIRDAISRDGGDTTVMVVCLNVDNSKEVNETFGHATGDALLTKIASRLQRFEAPNRCTAGRIGGNEFALLVVGTREEGAVEASNMLSRLGKCLRRPLQVDDVTLEPRISMGVAGYPFDAQAASELLLHADLALKEARESGEPFCFFSLDYQDALHARRSLLGDLRKGLGREELAVFYQPQADAQTGRVCGFEALVRWRHPERGLLGPDKFIPLAEESGLIVELGEQVLRRACADAVSWPRSVSVAVNLSALQLGDPRIVTLVHEVLLQTGLTPARLELEITETALTRDFQAALDALRRLKAMGVRIAMDDFGTGYSSLSTLHSFPFDKIKIDKSFVDGLGQLQRSTVIVRSVLGMAAGLGMPVTAEGVETAAQREILRAEGCAELQGYLIGKPAPIETQRALLAGEARAAA